MVSLSLGELISSHRSRRNLSLSDLAEMSGVSKSTLSSIESGETKRPSYTTWKKIADAMDIAPSTIINAFVDTTYHPKTLEIVLAEVIREGWEALVAKVAIRYLESPGLIHSERWIISTAPPEIRRTSESNVFYAIRLLHSREVGAYHPISPAPCMNGI